MQRRAERYGRVLWWGEVVAVVRTVTESHMMDKNWEGYLRSEQFQPQARLHSPGFQCQEDKSP